MCSQNMFRELSPNIVKTVAANPVLLDLSVRGDRALTMERERSSSLSREEESSESG